MICTFFALYCMLVAGTKLGRATAGLCGKHWITTSAALPRSKSCWVNGPGWQVTVRW